MSKIAIPKNECYQDQKRCITISKGLLERLFSDGYSNNELTEKNLTVSTTEKFLPESAGSLTRVLQLEHQTLLDWHDISLQPIHLR